ncbi:hypothetical protein CONPUDRAFT_165799 [Coniophora puteana RWD-64-598 SS2]|uniref:DUF6533 domain-containing protein n=1 Tax=Coniophora puteana (strain RWD-64-598) TaxID=741705 RepID=A0A5M3MNA7_CONPW|nr:uncharacterized protein CONPUDRAFT_165799 [Coniophora puteana RWD-64-598 SS2]EIW80205.1 hypothetical protein CONPUDRAFT_165799 [Coniophora puteana RWD-64-598 SS2]
MDVGTIESVVDMQLIWVSLLCLAAYDTCLTFADEVRFLRHSRLSFMKVVYVGIRLTMFVSLISGSSLPMRGSLEQCNVLGKLAELPSIIGLIAVEIMFIGRVYALWSCDKRVLVPTLLTLGVHIASLAVIATLPGTQMRPVAISDGWIACLPPHRNELCVIIIGTIFVLDTEILGLTLYRSMAYFRSRRLRLVEIVIHHNVVYLVCALVIAVVNMTLILTLYNNFMPSIFQGVFSSIVATRMHRRLWMTLSESAANEELADVSVVTYKDKLCCSS